MTAGILPVSIRIAMTPSLPVPNQESPVPSAQSTTNADDDRVRVTTWTFQDGEETGPHRHDYDYLVVPVTGGTFEVVDRSGAAREMTQQAAGAYMGREGTEHNVINRSGRVAIFVEVEFKR
jgi:quercetin dioxygenase-like cupin family protein